MRKLVTVVALLILASCSRPTAPHTLPNVWEQGGWTFYGAEVRTPRSMWITEYRAAADSLDIDPNPDRVRWVAADSIIHENGDRAWGVWIPKHTIVLANKSPGIVCHESVHELTQRQYHPDLKIRRTCIRNDSLVGATGYIGSTGGLDPPPDVSADTTELSARSTVVVPSGPIRSRITL